jgi:hypothetical protein
VVEIEEVVVSPSSDTTWISVFCHRIGMASHKADVFAGTTHDLRLLSAGKLIGTCGVGAGAGQTLVRVWPTKRGVLHPWPVSTVLPPTQSQFLSIVRKSSFYGIRYIRRTAHDCSCFALYCRSETESIGSLRAC